MGIRPEHVHAREFVPPGIRPASARATVEVAEPLGNEIFLHLRLEGRPLLARVDARTEARPGQEIEIALDLGRLYAFDPATDEAIAG